MKKLHPVIAGIVSALVLGISQVAEAQLPQANTPNPKATAESSSAAKSLLDQTSNASQARTFPNILFILTDDLGWRDLSCYGSTFYETPNIDRLASQGMRFTDAYASAGVCSP
ncbi:MAG TPA: hypothetical protein EYG38_08635, partial [Verrucomicrobia bacterium]|nr:hypothetical protein [Verrucomicrobiota bacterium]